MAAKMKVTWAEIEPDWRAGVKSVQQLADEYTQATGVSITKVAISKHFKKLGIERDLTARVQSKAQSLVSAAMVSGKVSIEATSATEAEIINTSALAVANVRVAHRAGIQDLRTLCEGMAAELKTVSSKDLIEKLERAIAVTPETPEEIAESQVYISKLIEELSSLPQRIGGLQRLVDSYSKLVAMERQAFNITENEAPNDPHKMSDAQRNSAIASLVKTAITRAARKRGAVLP